MRRAIRIVLRNVIFSWILVEILERRVSARAFPDRSSRVTRFDFDVISLAGINTVLFAGLRMRSPLLAPRSASDRDAIGAISEIYF